MSTIKKGAYELKPGDVFMWGGLRVVALQVCDRGRDIDVLTARIQDCDAMPGQRLSRGSYPRQCEMEVEQPALTRAQEHADELLRDVKVFLACDKNKEAPFRSFIERAEILVAQIDPPAQPTLEEAIGLLGLITKSHPDFKPVSEFLDRARRAGVKA